MLTMLFYIITQLVLLDQLLGGHDANLEGNSIINSWFIQSSARVKSKHAPVLLRRAGHNPPTIILVGGLCVWAAWPSPQDVCLFIDEFVPEFREAGVLMRRRRRRRRRRRVPNRSL